MNQVLIMRRWTKHCPCPHGAYLLQRKEEVRGVTEFRWERGKRSLWEVRVSWKPERWVRALQAMSRQKSDREKARGGGRDVTCVVRRRTGNRKEPQEGLGVWYLCRACRRKRRLRFQTVSLRTAWFAFRKNPPFSGDTAGQIFTNTPRRVTTTSTIKA